MTKTLHLYEPHFISLVEECMASEHKLMATAVLEPFLGDEISEADAGPGAFVGGYNFSLSCGCLVQVLSAKPYTGGYLVRIRGEARLGISGLPQTGPYLRAQVYPLPDQPTPLAADQQEELRSKVTQLQDILRDVQNLASKFRCDETAALQQAMRWLYAAPITPGIQQPSPGVHGCMDPEPGLAGQEPLFAAGGTASGRGAGGDPGASGSVHDNYDRNVCSTSSGRDNSAAGNSCDGGGGSGAAATDGAMSLPSHRHRSSLGNQADGEGALVAGGVGEGRGGHHAAASAQAGVGAHVVVRTEGPAANTGVDDDGEEDFDPEGAVRLSWASLQWLPHASTEERMYMVRTRLLAMDTRDVGRRLDLALEAMSRARASLAAKCAIKAAS
ncbi:hypothetical protein VOLCADRAFT_105320 [Volvox carteri f. nagariensis]|uniref:Lon N-terminal domain-containing protein n=1 Tax=Volvox carteri f. nagariensis TaxID=3068 RepID=D8U019_VOLCA|nr:uncharacterized protein VOLCADRAFT_105320 [Volvox carteri f. nagariensis]EFJ46860.1 hypothetical protein VOLCADRAFT_105320 [Volvox carteri f. nagariensis]|eukprot:XP_002952069.1 hypothetical protein VOLCADRAFT_105320 [Volvox carteri f. nagariensis]